MITIQAETPVIRASASGTFAPAARTSKVVLVDGIHDLGGMQGFGAVGHSPAEPAFHHRWEAVARALLVVVAGAVTGRWCGWTASIRCPISRLTTTEDHPDDR
jgi:Nitrile hydratase beta subunit, N-terminal